MTTPQPNILQVGNMAQNMASKAEGMEAKLFQKIALVSMGVMALASAGSMLISLLHELNRKNDRDKGRGR